MSKLLLAVLLPIAALATPVARAAIPGPAPRLTGAPAPADDDVLPEVAPESVGMSRARLAAIDRVMARALAARGFPGAAVVVGRGGGIVWSRGYGRLDWSAGSAAVDPGRTMYDIASLTKVVATTAAAMALYDDGRLKLDAPVSRYLASFRGAERERVTVRQLLTHRAGLPAGIDLPTSPAAARRAVLDAPLERAPGSRTLYSDLGPDVLGFVVEVITGEPLDRFVRRRVYMPLGMRSTTFRPDARDLGRIAPTGAPPGIVHDPAARAMGGVAGHAGLFATATDLARFAQAMLAGGTLGGRRFATDSTVATFTRRSAGWRALGWDTCAGGGSCGQQLGEHAYGHTGFTGTSIWVDPDRELFVIVLTNHVLSPRAGDPTAILHDVRADIADIAALAVDGGVAADSLPRLRAERAIGWNGMP